jgi:small subunit ribosomal protein S13
MIRISGINIPSNKKIYISLTSIYGIGISTSKLILKNSKIDQNKICSTLSDFEISHLKKNIEKLHKVEGMLKKEISLNIKRLIEIKSYRGIRHRKALPVRGQNTHSNAKNARKHIKIRS